MWSPGYFVSSAFVDEEIIKRYVETKVARIQVNSEWSCDGNSPDFSWGKLLEW